jgi:hypothetical protein
MGVGRGRRRKVRAGQAGLDSANQGIAPAQAREAGKVMVRGTKLGAVFNGEGSQMCIGSEIAGCAKRDEQLAD